MRKHERSKAAAAPPDLIVIPDRLKSVPIDWLYQARGFKGRTSRYPGRLQHVLRDAGVRLLGDLDGKRLSDFEQRRTCGVGTVLALRTMLLRALYPGVRKRSGLKPIRMRDHKALVPVMEVAEFCRGLNLDDLPMSVRLERGLRRLGARRLGQLHGVPIRESLAGRNYGRKTVSELQALVLRANTGEFNISAEERAASRPGDLLRQIDRLVVGLQSRDRSFLTLRLGAGNGRKRTLAWIGRRHGVSYNLVKLRLQVVFRLMRREGGPRLLMLLKMAKDYCAERNTELGPDVLARWRGAVRGLRYGAEFYARVIEKLMED